MLYDFNRGFLISSLRHIVVSDQLFGRLIGACFKCSEFKAEYEGSGRFRSVNPISSFTIEFICGHTSRSMDQ